MRNRCNRAIGLLCVTLVSVVMLNQVGFASSTDIRSNLSRLGDLPIGHIIKIKENGLEVNYIIVSQKSGIIGGKDLYDESCNGTWLMREELTSTTKYNPQWADGGVRHSNNWSRSRLRSYLNTDIFERYDDNTKAAIKDVEIPYCSGHDYTNREFYTGFRGAVSKVFILSAIEAGGKTNAYEQHELDRHTLDGGIIEGYKYVKENGWTRTPAYSSESKACYVSENNERLSWRDDVWEMRGIQPVFVLSQDTLITTSNEIGFNTRPSAPTSVTINNEIKGNLQHIIQWTPANDIDGNMAGYIVERTLNNGATWENVGTTNSLSYKDIVPVGEIQVQYRVLAYDSIGAMSDYTNSNIGTVINISNFQVEFYKQR